MTKKIMISVDESLLADIEDYAKRMHLNRSASFSVLCSTALQAQKSMNTLDELMQAYKAEKTAQESMNTLDGLMQAYKAEKTAQESKQEGAGA